jgi:hypothetical protein
LLFLPAPSKSILLVASNARQLTNSIPAVCSGMIVSEYEFPSPSGETATEMLSSAYLSRNLTLPLLTKDGGTLRTIGEACEYMAAIGKERELRPHWQQVRELMLQEADVAAVSWRVQLAVLKDAKLDVTALSEPIERMMDGPPPGVCTENLIRFDLMTESLSVGRDDRADCPPLEPGRLALQAQELA